MSSFTMAQITSKPLLFPYFGKFLFFLKLTALQIPSQCNHVGRKTLGKSSMVCHGHICNFNSPPQLAYGFDEFISPEWLFPPFTLCPKSQMQHG